VCVGHDVDIPSYFLVPMEQWQDVTVAVLRTYNFLSRFIVFCDVVANFIAMASSPVVPIRGSSFACNLVN